MAQSVTRTTYKCGLCELEFGTEVEALQCEAKPITEDKGVKVGDKVWILHGQGTGEIATVERIVVVKKDWGHYAWERYWHTIAVSADCTYPNGTYSGTRFLTFDSYRPVE